MKPGDFAAGREAQLELDLPAVADRGVLRLRAQRKHAGRLDVGSDDLIESHNGAPGRQHGEAKAQGQGARERNEPRQQSW